MSIDIEGLMAEVEKFRNRLAQLGDELTLNSEKNAFEATKRQTVRQGGVDGRDEAQVPDATSNAVSATPEPESELAALVRSAFAHKTRRSRRS